MRGAYLTIDLSALRQNYRTICDHIGDTGIQKLCVIKANAYGAGALEVAKVLADESVDYLGVATLEEGIELRGGGIETPILVLGYVPDEDIAAALQHRLTLSVYDVDQAGSISRNATAAGLTARVHLKIDTGLGRLGFFPDRETIPLVQQMVALPGLEFEGIFTHFAISFQPEDTFTPDQFIRFNRFLADLGENGMSFSIIHASNSGGIVFFRESYYQMVRIGIILYGLSPSPPGVDIPIPLKSIYSIEGRVGSVKVLPEGHSVGYGRGFRAKKPTRVALIPLGYVDGIPRAYERKGEILIRGTRCRIVGGIAMDQFLVDVTHLEDLKIGEPFVLLGQQGGEEVTVLEIAIRAGTNAYEVSSRFGSRLPRVFINSD